MSSQLQIRQWLREDIPALVDLVDANMPYAWAEAVFADCFKENYYGFVVVNNQQQCVGFVVVLLQADICQLLNICVDARYQGRGIAKALLLSCLPGKRTIPSYKVIQLEVRSSNQRAIQFYKKLGFTQTGLRKHYYPGDNEDALLFEWIVSSLPS